MKSSAETKTAKGTDVALMQLLIAKGGKGNFGAIQLVINTLGGTYSTWEKIRTVMQELTELPEATLSNTDNDFIATLLMVAPGLKIAQSKQEGDLAEQLKKIYPHNDACKEVIGALNMLDSIPDFAINKDKIRQLKEALGGSAK